jgi:serine/threonine protein kinase
MTEEEKLPFKQQAMKCSESSQACRMQLLGKALVTYNAADAVSVKYQIASDMKEIVSSKILTGEHGCFFVGELLGQGSFGEVFKVTQKHAQEEYAAKVAHSASTLQDLGQECELLRLFQSMYVVSSYGFVSQGATIGLLMELAPHGNLSMWLKQNHVTMADAPFVGRWRTAWQLATGLAHVHRCQVLHCDIKPANVLVFNSGALVKLADFGLAKRMDQKGNTRACVVGNLTYSAPYRPTECIIADECHLYIASSADVFALGSSLFDVFSLEGIRDLIWNPKDVHCWMKLQGRTAEGVAAAKDQFRRTRDWRLTRLLNQDNPAAGRLIQRACKGNTSERISLPDLVEACASELARTQFDA